MGKPYFMCEIIWSQARDICRPTFQTTREVHEQANIFQLRPTGWQGRRISPVVKIENLLHV